MGEPVQQCPGEALRTEDLGPFVEWQVGGDQDGAPLVALAEDLEEQIRPGGGHFVDEQQAEAGQLPLEVEQRYPIPGLQRSALPRLHRRDAPARYIIPGLQRSALPKLNPRWDVHLRNYEDGRMRPNKDLHSVSGGQPHPTA